MLERQKRLKSGVQYYVANFKNDKCSIITAKARQLVNHIILLFERFIIVTKEYSKENQCFIV